MTATLLCVLRTGGDFEPIHVTRLMSQWAARAPAVADEFMCLTDNPIVATSAPLSSSLVHAWPGFFAKIEVFRVPGPCLYMDLDVNVVGDLEPLVQAVMKHDFIVCRDFAHGGHVLNTSVMGWSGDMTPLYQEFAKAPRAVMSVYDDPNRWQEPGRGWGDQGFVRDHWHGPIAYWQDLLPGAVVSYKADVLGKGIDAERARIVVSHGRPRPWERSGADEKAWV